MIRETQGQLATKVSKKEFGFKAGNVDSIQNLLDLNRVNLGNQYGDELGLDVASPRANIVSSTVEDANTYHSRNEAQSRT